MQFWKLEIDFVHGKSPTGLRALYRTLELPSRSALNDAHAALNAAVLDAYRSDAREDLLTQLLELTLAIAMREKQKEPVTAPASRPPMATRPRSSPTTASNRPQADDDAAL